MRRKIVAIIGDAVIERDGPKFKAAYETAKLLVDNGYRIQSGGMLGVMEAAFMGAKASEKYREGDTVAIIPSFERNQVNDYADIVIATGMDITRNVLVAGADAVIAIGGGAGTLSEIAFAWTLKRLLLAFETVDGASSEVANKRMDHRLRYDFEDDKVFGVKSAEEAVKIINQKIDLYNKYHTGIAKLFEDK